MSTVHHNVKDIFFPNPNMFCQSYSTANTDVELLLPLNSKTKTENDQGLYIYNTSTNEFKMIFKYNPEEICFRALYSNNTYILNFTTSNEIRVYKDNTIYKSVLLEGCPNDICLDEVSNKLYIGINREFPENTGLICELDLINYTLRYLVGEKFAGYTTAENTSSISIVSGIAVKNNYLYVATLMNIVMINLLDLNDINIIVHSSDFDTCPNFDNFTIYNDKFYVSIYNYGDYFSNFVLRHPILHKIIHTLYWCSRKSVFETNINPDLSPMVDNSFVHYLELEYNNSNTYTYKIIDIIFDKFDKEVTQIGKISSDTYCMINYKANKFIIYTEDNI